MIEEVVIRQYKCDSCGKKKKAEMLPNDWSQFRFSIALAATNTIHVSAGHGNHRVACSKQCFDNILSTDVESLKAKENSQKKRNRRE